MDEKNRFSNLLRQLMTLVNLKNYTLARALQYDVSYISKWVSGRMIPSEKTAQEVLHGISACVVDSAAPEPLARLMQDYRVEDPELLKLAIYDNLKAEYEYVRDAKANTTTSTSTRIQYYPQLSISQFVQKMHHPVLRRVKSLEVTGMMDLLSMNDKDRQAIISLDCGENGDSRTYPGVHFSMVINLTNAMEHCMDSTMFLIKLLIREVNVEFELYNSQQALGRVIFAVQNEFAISGMLTGGDQCISVAVGEDPENSRLLYQTVQSYCNAESQVFKRTTMRDLVDKYGYLYSILSGNQRWILGHITEALLPEDLLRELIPSYMKLTAGRGLTESEILSIHSLSSAMLKETHVRLLTFDATFSDLVTDGVVDFYGEQIRLDITQRIRCFEQLIELFKSEQLEIRLVRERTFKASRSARGASVHISDALTYLRISNPDGYSRLEMVKNSDILRMFDQFYEEIWNYRRETSARDQDDLFSLLRHDLQSVHLMQRVEKCDSILSPRESVLSRVEK